MWLRHVTTWSTKRRPGRPRLGKTLRDADFRRLPLFKGTWFHPVATIPHQRRSPPAGCFPTHPHLSVALRRLRACGPGRGRARAGLWGGLPRRVPPTWSPMRPPRRGPGPARLPACGNPRNGMRKRRKQDDRRIWEDRSMWKDVRGGKELYAHTL